MQYKYCIMQSYNNTVQVCLPQLPSIHIVYEGNGG